MHALQLVQDILALADQVEECQFQPVLNTNKTISLPFSLGLFLACHGATHSRFRCV